MRKFIFFITFLSAVSARAQIAVNLQLPPAGLAVKSQLWSMLITNGGASKSIRVELKLTGAQTGNQVLTATTQLITLSSGGQLFQESSFTPIQYNITDPAFSGFAASPFLPPGQYIACYDVLTYEGQVITEECQAIEVEPLGPPQLIYPYDANELETKTPVFNWLPPVPVNLFSNLTYDFQLTEVLANQTAADATEQNIPLYSQSNITGNSLPYPAGAPALVNDHRYAWRISARNGASVVANSETWWFRPQDFKQVDSVAKNEMPFVRLTKDGSPAYAIFIGSLKFEYLNETTDTTWNYSLSDITAATPSALALPMDSIPLRRGENLVEIGADKAAGLISKHLYLLEIKNSREETWQLKFEYRKEEN